MGTGYDTKGMDQEELTRSPYVNELIKVCKAVREGSQDPKELQIQLDSLKEMIETLSVTAEALKLTQPKSEGFEEDYALLKELLELFRDELDNMGLYFEEEDQKYLVEPLEKIKKYSAEIFEITDKFKKVEDSQEIYSKSPFINDLIRVGLGYCSGEFELEPFRVRFYVVRDIFEETYANFSSMAELPPDTKTLEQELPRIRENLEEMKTGFEELDDYFRKENEDEKESVKVSLEKIQNSSRIINEIQEKIAEEISQIAEARTKRVCPRCGVRTPISDKFCAGCMSLLPPLPDETVEKEAALDFRADETGISQPDQQRIVPPHILKIYESALKVGRGEISKEEFNNDIKWYEEIVEKTRQDIKKLTKPQGLSEDEDMLFEDTRKLMDDSVTQADEGLAELKLYLKDEVLEHLVTGVNTLIDAGEKLVQINRLGEKAKRELERKK